MQIAQTKYTKKYGWEIIKTFATKVVEPQLIFVFGSVELFKDNQLIEEIINLYPTSIITGCTTSGNIGNTFVEDNCIICTAIFFEKSNVEYSCLQIETVHDSYIAGKSLIAGINKKNLRHIFVLSEGINVNGTQLVNGMQSELPPNITVTGGLAGDADNFNETFLFVNKNKIQKNSILAIGIYGDDIKVGYGSYGGWDIFGIDRMVTKSCDNIVYEIDNMPALALYKSYLGELSAELPSSALLFPLSLRTNNSDETVVRTILSVNEKEQSLTFAGDIPEGSYVKLMKANIDRLIDGASTAAQRAKLNLKNSEPEFAILVSCIGRKLVLKQLVEEEIDSVKTILGSNVVLTGFYSYGEISPFLQQEKCTLHNQTMTITTFAEQ